jgi:hypothetical protein
MWLNQDKMFADDEEEESSKKQFSENVEEKTIQALDDLACEIVDGNISVKSLRQGVDEDMRGRVDTNFDRTQKELRIKYTDPSELNQ